VLLLSTASGVGNLKDNEVSLETTCGASSNPAGLRRLAPFCKFQLISAIVGLFQKAKACQFHVERARKIVPIEVESTSPVGSRNRWGTFELRADVALKNRESVLLSFHELTDIFGREDQSVPIGSHLVP
jgi:hypothetical protein